MDRDEIEMDLNEIDEQILDVLEDGRATRKFIADDLDKTGEYIYQRVDVLIRLGIVEKIHDGFYQLAQEEEKQFSSTQKNQKQDEETSVKKEWKTPVPNDIPQQIENEEAKAAISAAQDYLQQEKRATMREIVANVMPEKPLGYDVPQLEDGQRFRGSWWRRIVKPGLEESQKVEKPAEGKSEWQWKENSK